MRLKRALAGDSLLSTQSTIRIVRTVKLGDTDTGRAATRTNPVHYETVKIRPGGRSKNERRNPGLAGGLMR